MKVRWMPKSERSAGFLNIQILSGFAFCQQYTDRYFFKLGIIHLLRTQNFSKN